MTPDDIIAVIERGMCHSADKAAECDVCATKRRAIAEVRTGREQLLAALAGIAERDAEIERLRAELKRDDRALAVVNADLRKRAQHAEHDLARLRARDERTARVIEAARRAVWQQTENNEAHNAHQALSDALDALDDATDAAEEREAALVCADCGETRRGVGLTGATFVCRHCLSLRATDAAEIEAAHDLGAACGASVGERAAHRWSGWPGAWCLDCGIQDPREACLASGECPCSDQVAAPCKVRVPPCTEPGSRRHDPYAERSVEERAAESAEPFDLRAHLQRQREWSERTFGPGARAAGVVDHIRKELREIEATPDDLEEWIDVVILALDGAWRSGATPDEIIAQLVEKQTKNERRKWPDWRTAEAGKAIEHVRADAQGAE